MEQRRKILPLTVIAAAILAYSSSFYGVFLLDDHVVLTGNRDISVFFPVCLSARMVVDLTFKLNYLVGEFKPADYHLVNLLIHVTAGLCLYGVIRRTLLLPFFGNRYYQVSDLVASVCACVWVAHPLTTQGVTYICQRYESLMGLFFLSNVYCFVRAVSSEKKRLWYDLSILINIVGMGTKEVMAMAPLVIIIYDYVFLSSSLREIIKMRWKVHLCQLLSIGVLVCLLLCSLAREVEVSSRLVHVSPLVYLANQCRIILYYLRLSVFPDPLCFDYAWIPSTSIQLLPYIFVTFVLLVGAVLGAYYRKAAGFLALSFFTILAPTSSIVPVADLVVEHRMYLPLISVVVLLVVGSYSLLIMVVKGGMSRAIKLWLISWFLLVAVFVGLTYIRNIDYHSEEVMWRDVLKKQPGNYRAGNDLAVALSEAGKFDQALQAYDKVLSAIPVSSLRDLETGRIVVRDVFIKNTPEYQYFVANANKALLMSSLPGGDEKAVELYMKALRIAPYNSNIREKIKYLLRKKGMSESILDTEIDSLLKKMKQRQSVNDFD